MSTLGELALGVVPDMSHFSGALTSGVRPGAETAGKDVGKHLGTHVLSTLKKFAAPIAAALTVGGLIKFAKSSISAYEDIVKAAMATQRQIGGTAGEASKLNFVFKQSGVDAGQAAASLRTFSRFATNAKDSTKILGFEVKDSTGHVKAMSTLLPQVADRFKSMNNGAEKTALAMKLFGRSGTELLPFLNKGAVGIEALTKKAKEMGVVVGDDDVAAMKKNAQVHRDWSTALEALKVTIGKHLMPVIEGIMLPILEKLTTWLTTKGIPLINKIADAMTAWAKKNTPQFKKAWSEVKDALELGYTALKKVYDFIQGHFTLKQQRQFLEVVAAVAVLKKTGVFNVGVKVVGAAEKLFQGGVIEVGAVSMQRAADTMVGAALGMNNAAKAMAGASGGSNLPALLGGVDPAGASGQLHAGLKDSTSFGGKGAVALGGMTLPEVTAIVAAVVATGFEVKWGIEGGSAKGAKAGSPYAADMEKFKKKPTVSGGLKVGLEQSPIGLASFELTRMIKSGTYSHMYEGFMNGFASPVAHWFKVDAKNAVTTGVGAITSQWNRLSGFVSSSFDSWWSSHGASVKAIWKGIKDDAVSVWHTISSVWADPKFKVAVKAVWDEVKLIVKTAMDTIGAIVKGVWDGIVLVLRVAWLIIKFVAKEVWDAIVATVSIALDILTGHWHKAWEDLTNFLKQTWNNLKDLFWGLLVALGMFFKSFWNDTLWPVLRIIMDFVTGSFVNAWHGAVQAISSVWGSLVDVIRTPVNAVVHWVLNPLITGFNDLANALHIGLHVPLIPDIGASGTGGGNDFRGHADGGYISGPGGPRDDLIPALLSNGEFVIPANVVRAFGVGFFNNMIGKSSAKYPGDGSAGIAYADGGLVGFFEKAWDVIGDTVKFITDPVSTLLGHVPGGGMMVDIVKAMATQLGGGLAKWAVNAGGGSGTGRTLTFLKAQDGKPYVWNAAGPGGYDCSGLVSAAYNVFHGKNAYSHTFSTMNEAPFFPKPGRGLFTAGWTNPGEPGPGGSSVGHTAGMLAGLGFESTGDHVRIGHDLTSLDAFAHMGTFDNGGYLLPGMNIAMNHTGRPEAVTTGATMDVVIDRLERLIMAVDRIAPGVGAEINRTGRAMMQLSRAT